MEIRNLITFQKIIELGSFSAAAEQLGYSQSTVTMQIKQLEEELGVPLFDRIGRRTSINQEGLRFQKYADNIINESRNALADLRSSTEPSGELRIGILDSICTAQLPELLHSYHMQYPNVTTVIEIGTYTKLAGMLDNHQIDILWIFDHKIFPGNWNLALDYASEISVIAPSDHPLAKKSSIHLYDLATEPLILTEADCSYRIDFLSLLASHGITPNIFLEIGNTELIKKFVEASLGLAVLPRYTIEAELTSHSLISLPVKEYHSTMYGQLFYHKNCWVSAALQSFIDLAATTLVG